MKKLIFAIAMLILSFNSFAQKNTYVNGYYRSNGTYVSGYNRTTPDYTKNNNYSTIGNINPYTGEYGAKPGGLNPSYYSSSTSTYTVPSYSPSNNDYLLPGTNSSNYFSEPLYTPAKSSNSTPNSSYYSTYDYSNYNTLSYPAF